MDYQSLVAFNGWTFIAQILNLFIQLYLFKRFLFKPIKNILAKRQAEVDAIYDEADKAKLDAETAKSDYEAHLLTANTEAEAITQRAMDNARAQSEALISSAQAEAAAMKQKAEADIELERRKAVNEMKGEISELAVSIASKVVSKDLTAEDHERLIEQFIEDLGDAAPADVLREDFLFLLACGAVLLFKIQKRFNGCDVAVGLGALATFAQMIVVDAVVAGRGMI